MAIKEELGKFRDIEGFQAVAVFTANGEMVENVTKKKIDINNIGLHANNALLNAQKATEEMKVGRGNLMEIRAPQAVVMMRCLNEATDFSATKAGRAHFHTVVVLDPDGNAAMAKMILDSVVEKVAEELR
jgi:predicted regulator of Ras-like GTPase activity (Roadblock/LC7/MglB family)